MTTYNDLFNLHVSFDNAQTCVSTEALKAVLNSAVRYVQGDINVTCEYKYLQAQLLRAGIVAHVTSHYTPTRAVLFTNRTLDRGAVAGLRAKYATQDVRICKIA